MNSPSWSSLSLSVQWAPLHSMVHLIGMCECSTGAGEICCAYLHESRAQDSPADLCWWFSWLVIHWQYFLHLSTYGFGKVFFKNKDWCSLPQEIIYIIMMREWTEHRMVSSLYILYFVMRHSGKLAFVTSLLENWRNLFLCAPNAFERKHCNWMSSQSIMLGAKEKGRLLEWEKEWGMTRAPL